MLKTGATSLCLCRLLVADAAARANRLSGVKILIAIRFKLLVNGARTMQCGGTDLYLAITGDQQ